MSKCSESPKAYCGHGIYCNDYKGCLTCRLRRIRYIYGRMERAFAEGNELVVGFFTKEHCKKIIRERGRENCFFIPQSGNLSYAIYRKWHIYERVDPQGLISLESAIYIIDQIPDGRNLSGDLGKRFDVQSGLEKGTWREEKPESSLSYPANEEDVIEMYRAMQDEYGWTVVHLQSRFPDAVIGNESGVELVVEFEFRAKNFQRHNHDPEGCDLIVCWCNDWSEAPVPVWALEETDIGIVVSRACSFVSRRLKNHLEIEQRSFRNRLGWASRESMRLQAEVDSLERKVLSLSSVRSVDI